MYTSDAPAAYWRDQMIAWGPRVAFAILILVLLIKPEGLMSRGGRS